MILHRRVALDGVQLDQVDNRIIIQGIEPAAGKDQLTTISLAGGAGSRVTSEHRDSLDIAVRFTINEKSYRPQARAEVFEKVMKWAANGGWLTVNYKPDRRIRVIAAQLPAEGDLHKRSEFVITFRAYGVPYWQQAEASSLRLNGVSSVSRSFGVDGSRQTVMDITFKNTSGSTCNTLTITCGGSSLSFSDLGLAHNETLVIDHNDTGRQCLQRIRILNAAGTSYRSAMSKRSGSDDLFVNPGVNNVVLSAQRSGTLLISCAGRFA